MKVLKPYGPSGRYEEDGADHWNYCMVDEFVGVFGDQTEEKKKFDYAISFNGCMSGLETSRAIVCEVDEETFEAGLNQFAVKITSRMMFNQNWTEEIRDTVENYCYGSVESMRTLSDDISIYRVGQVLCVEKSPTLRFIPQVNKTKHV